jgi:hypothetical protein
MKPIYYFLTNVWTKVGRESYARTSQAVAPGSGYSAQCSPKIEIFQMQPSPPLTQLQRHWSPRRMLCGCGNHLSHRSPGALPRVRKGLGLYFILYLIETGKQQSFSVRILAAVIWLIVSLLASIACLAAMWLTNMHAQCIKSILCIVEVEHNDQIQQELWFNMNICIDIH